MIDRARWRWRTLAGISVLFALLAFGAWGATGKQARVNHLVRSSATVAHRGVRAARRQAGAKPRTRLIHVASGKTLKRFEISQPEGTIQLLRVAVPHGTPAKLTASIPHVASIGISTPRSSIPSETCHRHGAFDVCTQAEEACPMPGATWHFQLHKLAGPAGEVRVQFAVG